MSVDGTKKSTLEWMNPASDKFNAIDKFEELSAGQKFLVGLATFFSGLALIGPGVAVFRLTVGHFSEKNHLINERTRKVSKERLWKSEEPKGERAPLSRSSQQSTESRKKSEDKATPDHKQLDKDHQRIISRGCDQENADAYLEHLQESSAYLLKVIKERKASSVTIDLNELIMPESIGDAHRHGYFKFVLRHLVMNGDIQWYMTARGSLVIVSLEPASEKYAIDKKRLEFIDDFIEIHRMDISSIEFDSKDVKDEAQKIVDQINSRLYGFANNFYKEIVIGPISEVDCPKCAAAELLKKHGLIDWRLDRQRILVSLV